jgi:hypothetical protein
MTKLKVGLMALCLPGLVGCETLMPEGLFSGGLDQAVRSYAGQPVSNRQPQNAYRQVDQWQQREQVGAQRMGPFQDNRGQQYMVVRRFYNDGSYEDSPPIYGGRGGTSRGDYIR